MDITTLRLAKKYTDDSLAGGGAVKGDKGDPGDTPYIGDNGNWWVGDTDTGETIFASDEEVEEMLTDIFG